MNFKLGLMHASKPVHRVPVVPVDFYAPRRVTVVADRPVEFLVRIREARRSTRWSWKGN